MSTTDFERLERLEQAITLCLQEIDHSFIRCHRVATACLPVVERYAEQSRAVWHGAKVPYPCRRDTNNSSGNNSLKQLQKYRSADTRSSLSRLMQGTSLGRRCILPKGNHRTSIVERDRMRKMPTDRRISHSTRSLWRICRRRKYDITRRVRNKSRRRIRRFKVRFSSNTA
jgi:hypothetical protein